MKEDKTVELIKVINELLNIISENVELIYLVGFALFFIFLYAFVKMILDITSDKKVDKALERNNEVLLKVHESLGKVHSVLISNN